MKHTIASILAILSATCSLAAFGALNNSWTNICYEVAYQTTPASSFCTYASAQRGVIACADLDETALTTPFTIFDYSGDNQVKLSTTADGKYNLLSKNGNTTKFDVTSEAPVTAGRHIFATLIRRGISGGNGHVISIIVYMDGQELFKVGDGSTACGTGPYRQIYFGTSESTCRVTGALWSTTESCGTADTDATTIAKIVADANALYGSNVLHMPYRLSFDTLGTSGVLLQNESDDFLVGSITPAKWKGGAWINYNGECKTSPYAHQTHGGAASLVKTSDKTLASGNEDYTIGFWFKKTGDISTWRNILGFKIADKYYAVQRGDATEYHVYRYTSGSAVAELASFTMDEDNWHHILLSFSTGGVLKIYVDQNDAVVAADANIKGDLEEVLLGGAKNADGTEESGRHCGQFANFDELAIYTGRGTDAQMKGLAAQDRACVPARKLKAEATNVEGGTALANLAWKDENGVSVTFDADYPIELTGEGLVTSEDAFGGSITIGSGVTFAPSSVIASAKVKGAGEIVYRVAPGNEKTCYTLESWTGTVWLKRATSDININNFNFDNYGHAGSKVKLTGVTGYGASGTVVNYTEVVLADDGTTKALTINNGYSGNSYQFKKLSGSGTFTTSSTTAQVYRSEDLSDFDGTIDIPSGKGMIFVVGNSDHPKTETNGRIIIDSGYEATIASGSTWTAANGIVVEGTLFNNGIIASAVSGSGRIVQQALPTGATYLTSLQAEAWNGTLALTAQNFTAATQLSLDAFGNKGSTIELNGISGGSVYMANDITIPSTINLKGNVTFNNGFSGSTSTFNILTGNKDLTIQTWAGCYDNPDFGLKTIVNTLDHYEGTLNLVNGSTKTACKQILSIGNIIVDDYEIEAPLVKSSYTVTSAAAGRTATIDVSATTLNGLAANLAVASDGIYIAVAKSTVGEVTTYYATLEAAVTAVGRDALNTITVLEEGATVPEGYVVKDDKISIKPLDTILPGTLTWLPVGDSITEGEINMGHPEAGDANTRGGYRYQLWKLLTDGGQATKSVGFRTGHGGAGNGSGANIIEDPATCDWAWHGGMYGGVISPLTCSGKKYGAHLYNVESFLEVSGYPDVISIMIGINDLSFAQNVDTVFSVWVQLVEKYATLRPNSKIVVSTLLPTVKSNVTSSMYGPFNEKIRAAQKAGSAPFNHGNVILADVAKAAFADTFNAANYKGDGIHPNEAGSKLVAKAFLNEGFIPAMEAIAADALKLAQIHNGTAGQISVRLSKAIETTAALSLELTGVSFAGDEVSLNLTEGVLAADKKTVTFTTTESLVNGSYAATLTVGAETIAGDKDTVYDIVGTGAASNVKAAMMSGFKKYQTVTPNTTSYTLLSDSTLIDKSIKRVGYYMELKRANEPAQFVWVSMDATPFSKSTNKVGLPTADIGTIKAIASNVTVFGNRGNFAKEVSNARAVVEFTPHTYTAADQSGDNCIADASPNGAFGWNDTLATSGSFGCMQVARITEDARTATTPAAEMLFAYNAFNYATYSDIGIGSLSTHRSNAGASIDAVYDWTWITPTAQIAPFMPSAYESMSIETWVELEGADPIEVSEGKTVEETVAALRTGGEIVILDDTQVALEGNTLTIGNGVYTLAAYYTPSIADGKIVVALNEMAKPIIAGATIEEETVEPIEITGTEVAVAIKTQAGLKYQLQKKAELKAADWTNSGNAVAGTGQPIQLKATKPEGETSAFYRVTVTDKE